jgi:hypothetical protein
MSSDGLASVSLLNVYQSALPCLTSIMLEETPSFPDWIDLVFNHPEGNEAWYWNTSIDPSIPSKPFIDYTTRLFQNTAELLARFSDRQVCYGLKFLTNNIVSDQIFGLKDSSVPLQLRLQMLNGIFDLNRDCFNRRCTPHLSHLHRSESASHVSALNELCFIWWDTFIVWPDEDEASMLPLADACLRVMVKCLSLSNVAVLEGALHGLGHFHMGYEKEVPEIIRNFLKSRPDLPEALRAYANHAATGDIL